MNLSLTDIANNAQRQASDPYISAWVSASAGSGKTKVLTDRILQLLLAKNEPETILCLTFTKAAAAEMANRLSKTLKDWMLLDNDKLIEELKKLTGQDECDLVEKIDFARTLFAKVLDTKGGMKIMTIHSFCQSILKRFPLEAGILPSFEIAEDATAKELLNNAIMQTFRNPVFQKQMYILSGYLEQKDLLKLLSDIRSDQLELEHLLDENMSFQSLQEKIYTSLDVHPNQTENDLIKTVYEGNDFEAYKLKFLTKKNEIRDCILKKGDEQKEIAQKILIVLEKINSLKIAQATCAFLSVAFDVLQNFETLKNKAGLLDYTDLIFKTRALLEEKDMTAWVLYKLDGGIDHILLDEAQDTSPDQWAIIRAICEEFFAGEGRKAPR